MEFTKKTNCRRLFDVVSDWAALVFGGLRIRVLPYRPYSSNVGHDSWRVAAARIVAIESRLVVFMSVWSCFCISGTLWATLFNKVLLDYMILNSTEGTVQVYSHGLLNNK